MKGKRVACWLRASWKLTVGDEVFILEPGDSYYFESSKPHRFRNPFEQPARLISATTPATF